VLDCGRLAQAVGEYTQTVHTHLVQALQHLVGNAGCDDSLLERIAVDEHRRLQRLEAGHAHGVEDPCSSPAEIGLSPRYTLDNLLLCIVRVVAAIVAGGCTSELVQLADRVGALDGRLMVEPTRLRAELPCG
jgi:hypothetical protein